MTLLPLPGLPARHPGGHWDERPRRGPDAAGAAGDVLPAPAKPTPRPHRGPTQLLTAKQVPRRAGLGLLLALERGALLASREVQRSGTTDLGEKLFI